jgi:hypothetical protein
VTSPSRVRLRDPAPNNESNRPEEKSAASSTPSSRTLASNEELRSPSSLVLSFFVRRNVDCNFGLVGRLNLIEWTWLLCNWKHTIRK